MDWLRSSARLAGAVLVAAGGLAVLAGLVTPWAWGGPTRPSAVALFAVAVLGPAAGVAVARGWMRGGALVGAGAAALAGTVAGFLLWRVDPAQGIRFGGPLAVLGCLGLVAGWLLRLAVPGRPRPGLVPVAVTCVVVLGAGGAAVPAVGWYTEGRFAYAGTASALPDVAQAAPADPRRQRWQASVGPIPVRFGRGAPVLAGRHLVVPQRDSVRVLDAVTGQPRWAYRRGDGTEVIDVAATTGGGATTVVLYGSGHGGLAVGLKTATGERLWQRRLPGMGAARLAAADGAMLVDDSRPIGGGPIIGLDAATGRPLWTWDVAAEVGDCTVHGPMAVAGPVVALLMWCPGDADDAVVALSVRDGRQRWRWHPPSGRLSHESVARAAGERIWVAYLDPVDRGTDRERLEKYATLLDAGTGAASGRHAVAAEAVGAGLPLLSGGSAVYLTDKAVGVDLATGAVRWTRPMPPLATWKPVDAAVRDGTGYVLLASRDGAPSAQDGAPLRLLAIDVANGQTTVDVPYDPGDCRTACAQDARASILAGPGLLVVAEVTGQDTTRLTSAG